MRKSTVFRTLIAVLLLAGCAPATASPAPSTEAPQTEAPVATTEAPAATTEAPAPVEITFWSWVPKIEDQVAEWNAAHPEIKVNYVNAGNGNTEYTKLNTSLQANADIPDVVQIEYQHLPNYIAQDVLLNLADYGANDVKDKFVPWTWSQVSQGDGVYAYPQDAGPMVMFCNQAVLDKYKIAAPTTWDEFAKAAADLHKADANVYLSNFTTDQGWFFGLLWQSGAKPFVVNGKDITVDFSSPEATRVAKFWGDLIASGNLSPIDTYTDDWNAALGKGTIACWPSGSWGTYISSYATDEFKGKWKVYLMPQWESGGKSNGNYGGSSIAVAKVTTHPKEAAAFAQWLNTDSKVALELTNPDKAGLFPVTLDTLGAADWSDTKYDFWSGDPIHATMAEGAKQVLPDYGWSPFTGFVYTTYTDDLTKVIAKTMTFEDLMKDLQDKSVQYGKEQGFNVK